jgi:formyl-CoA transferase
MAGPFASMLLGDMGADVIKIEPTDGGDQTRRAMGFKLKGNDSLGSSISTATSGASRSISEQARPRSVLPAGRDLGHRARELPAGRDKRLGIDYETLSRSIHA